MNSRSKGARGEREAAKAWASVMGGTARRGQQFAGGTESPDVVSSHETLHLEVKRCEVGNPYLWVEQAVRDAGDKCPVVLHRRNGKPWLLIVRLEDGPRLAEAIGQTAPAVGGCPVPAAVPGQGDAQAPQGDGQHARLLGVRRGRGPRGHLPAEHAGQGLPDRHVH